MADGNKKIEISRCDGEGCEEEYDAQEISFTLERGETHVIEVTDSFFNGISLTSILMGQIEYFN
ncbi:MAG: hypothetical protein KJ737_02005 [Proteobacteria bacterium]|nr:hypothetical protein [Pseudomonadota bacterium]